MNRDYEAVEYTVKTTMKTMIFWLEKGHRKPKMQGLATAKGSTFTINDFRGMARRELGKLFIVTAENAANGRKLIQRYKENGLPGLEKQVLDNDHTILLGQAAIAAVLNTDKANSLHNQRVQTQGKVTWDQTRALITEK